MSTVYRKLLTTAEEAQALIGKVFLYSTEELK